MFYTSWHIVMLAMHLWPLMHAVEETIGSIEETILMATTESELHPTVDFGIESSMIVLLPLQTLSVYTELVPEPSILLFPDLDPTQSTLFDYEIESTIPSNSDTQMESSLMDFLFLEATETLTLPSSSVPILNTAPILSPTTTLVTSSIHSPSLALPLSPTTAPTPSPTPMLSAAPPPSLSPILNTPVPTLVTASIRSPTLIFTTALSLNPTTAPTPVPTPMLSAAPPPSSSPIRNTAQILSPIPTIVTASIRSPTLIFTTALSLNPTTAPTPSLTPMLSAAPPPSSSPLDPFSDTPFFLPFETTFQIHPSRIAVTSISLDQQHSSTTGIIKPSLSNRFLQPFPSEEMDKLPHTTLFPSLSTHSSSVVDILPTDIFFHSADLQPLATQRTNSVSDILISPSEVISTTALVFMELTSSLLLTDTSSISPLPVRTIDLVPDITSSPSSILTLNDSLASVSTMSSLPTLPTLSFLSLPLIIPTPSQVPLSSVAHASQFTTPLFSPLPTITSILPSGVEFDQSTKLDDVSVTPLLKTESLLHPTSMAVTRTRSLLDGMIMTPTFTTRLELSTLETLPIMDEITILPFSSNEFFTSTESVTLPQLTSEISVPSPSMSASLSLGSLMSKTRSATELESADMSVLTPVPFSLVHMSSSLPVQEVPTVTPFPIFIFTSELTPTAVPASISVPTSTPAPTSSLMVFPSSTTIINTSPFIHGPSVILGTSLHFLSPTTRDTLIIDQTSITQTSAPLPISLTDSNTAADVMATVTMSRVGTTSTLTGDRVSISSFQRALTASQTVIDTPTTSTDITISEMFLTPMVSAVSTSDLIPFFTASSLIGVPLLSTTTMPTPSSTSLSRTAMLTLSKTFSLPVSTLIPSSPSVSALIPSLPSVPPSSPSVSTLIPSSPSVSALIPSSPVSTLISSLPSVSPSSPSVSTLIPSSPSVSALIPSLPSVSPSLPSVSTLIPSSPSVSALIPSSPSVSTLIPSLPSVSPSLPSVSSSSPSVSTLIPSSPSVSPPSSVSSSSPSVSTLIPSSLSTALSTSSSFITPLTPSLLSTPSRSSLAPSKISGSVLVSSSQGHQTTNLIQSPSQTPPITSKILSTLSPTPSLQPPIPVICPSFFVPNIPIELVDIGLALTVAEYASLVTPNSPKRCILEAAIVDVFLLGRLQQGNGRSFKRQVESLNYNADVTVISDLSLGSSIISFFILNATDSTVDPTSVPAIVVAMAFNAANVQEMESFPIVMPATPNVITTLSTTDVTSTVSSLLLVSVVAGVGGTIIIFLIVIIMVIICCMAVYYQRSNQYNLQAMEAGRMALEDRETYSHRGTDIAALEDREAYSHCGTDIATLEDRETYSHRGTDIAIQHSIPKARRTEETGLDVRRKKESVSLSQLANEWTEGADGPTSREIQVSPGLFERVAHYDTPPSTRPSPRIRGLRMHPPNSVVPSLSNSNKSQNSEVVATPTALRPGQSITSSQAIEAKKLQEETLRLQEEQEEKELKKRRKATLERLLLQSREQDLRSHGISRSRRRKRGAVVTTDYEETPCPSTHTRDRTHELVKIDRELEAELGDVEMSSSLATPPPLTATPHPSTRPTTKRRMHKKNRVKPHPQNTTDGYDSTDHQGQRLISRQSKRFKSGRSQRGRPLTLDGMTYNVQQELAWLDMGEGGVQLMRYQPLFPPHHLPPHQVIQVQPQSAVWDNRLPPLTTLQSEGYTERHLETYLKIHQEMEKLQLHHPRLATPTRKSQTTPTSGDAVLSSKVQSKAEESGREDDRKPGDEETKLATDVSSDMPQESSHIPPDTPHAPPLEDSYSSTIQDFMQKVFNTPGGVTTGRVSEARLSSSLAQGESMELKQRFTSPSAIPYQIYVPPPSRYGHSFQPPYTSTPGQLVWAPTEPHPMAPPTLMKSQLLSPTHLTQLRHNQDRGHHSYKQHRSKKRSQSPYLPSQVRTYHNPFQ